MLKIRNIYYNANHYAHGTFRSASGNSVNLNDFNWEDRKEVFLKSLANAELSEVLIIELHVNTETGVTSIVTNEYHCIPLKKKREINVAAKGSPDAEPEDLDEEELGND